MTDPPERLPQHAGPSADAPSDRCNYRLAVLATSSVTIRYVQRYLIEGYTAAGLRVTACSAADGEVADVLPDGVRFVPVPLTRAISPLADLRAIWALWRFFRRERFDLIEYTTNKAALLGSIAGFLARAPHRLYCIWGVYYETQRGWKCRMYRWIEWLTCRLSTCVVPNARGTADLLDDDRVAPRAKCQVINRGSARGVDVRLFNRTDWAEQGRTLRRELGIPADAVVIGILGRLTGDKGVNEMVAAFESLAHKHERLYLLIVGRQEDKDRLQPETEALMGGHERIKLRTWMDVVQPFYAALDVFCLPSYREGLPNVLLEAQAMNLPIVATDIFGCREAIVPGVSGTLVPVRDAEALASALERYIADATRRCDAGRAGREFIVKNFDMAVVVAATVAHRLRLLRSWDVRIDRATGGNP